MQVILPNPPPSPPSRSLSLSTDTHSILCTYVPRQTDPRAHCARTHALPTLAIFATPHELLAMVERQRERGGGQIVLRGYDVRRRHNYARVEEVGVAQRSVVLEPRVVPCAHDTHGAR